jgi:transforming growth factor-beta-induced protein
MQRKKLLFVLLAAMLLAGLGFAGNLESVTGTAVAQSEEQITEAEIIRAEEAETVMELLRTREELETFKVLVEAAGLADNLERDGPFTVFAPTNSALAALDSLLAQSEVTPTDALLYHVVNGRYTAAALTNCRALPALNGEPITFTVQDGTLILNNEVAITARDIATGNGVVHIVDTVALPPADSPLVGDRDMPLNTLDEIMAADGRFTTFLSLLERAGQIEVLANPNRNYTVFAPTDDAFAQWPEEQYERLLADADYLETFLSYHLVTDYLSISQTVTYNCIPTVASGRLIVSQNDEGRLLVNDRPAQSVNIMAANGVIHVLDVVLLAP